MSKEDLLNLIPDSSNNFFIEHFKKNFESCTILNIYMVDGELVKVGSGSRIKKNAVKEINSNFISIEYDSHTTDYLVSNIVKIEYY